MPEPIKLVNPFEAHKYQADAFPLLKQVLKRTGLDVLMEPEDLWKSILLDELQFWVVLEKKELVGIAVTEVRTFPKGMQFYHYLSSAKPHRGIDLEQCLRDQVAWAKSVGCIRVSVNGRLGWKRIYEANGFVDPNLSMHKVL